MASWYDLKGTLQKVFRIGNKNLTIDAQAPTAERTFYMPDSDVDMRGGASGQVLTQTGSNTVGWTTPTFTSPQNLSTTGYNETGSAIPKMSVVYIQGAHGNLPSLVLAQANTEAASSFTYGVTENAISDMSSGNVIEMGRLSNLDTNIVGWNEGDILYLSPTIAGGITNVKPSAPDNIVFVGVLVRKHPTQGVIQVKVQNGYELEELHNVSIPTTPNNGDVLTYDTATSLWKAAAASAGASGFTEIANGGNITGTYNGSVYCAGTVTFTGNVIVKGSLLAEGKVTNNGGYSLTVHGDCIFKGEVDFQTNTGVAPADINIDGNFYTGERSTPYPLYTINDPTTTFYTNTPVSAPIVTSLGSGSGEGYTVNSFLNYSNDDYFEIAGDYSSFPSYFNIMIIGGPNNGVVASVVSLVFNSSSGNTEITINPLGTNFDGTETGIQFEPYSIFRSLSTPTYSGLNLNITSGVNSSYLTQIMSYTSFFDPNTSTFYYVCQFSTTTPNQIDSFTYEYYTYQISNNTIVTGLIGSQFSVGDLIRIYGGPNDGIARAITSIVPDYTYNITTITTNAFPNNFNRIEIQVDLGITTVFNSSNSYSSYIGITGTISGGDNNGSSIIINSEVTYIDPFNSSTYYLKYLASPLTNPQTAFSVFDIVYSSFNQIVAPYNFHYFRDNLAPWEFPLKTKLKFSSTSSNPNAVVTFGSSIIYDYSNVEGSFGINFETPVSNPLAATDKFYSLDDMGMLFTWDTGTAPNINIKGNYYTVGGIFAEGRSGNLSGANITISGDVIAHHSNSSLVGFTKLNGSKISVRGIGSGNGGTVKVYGSVNNCSILTYAQAYNGTSGNVEVGSFNGRLYVFSQADNNFNDSAIYGNFVATQGLNYVSSIASPNGNGGYFRCEGDFQGSAILTYGGSGGTVGGNAGSVYVGGSCLVGTIDSQAGNGNISSGLTNDFYIGGELSCNTVRVGQSSDVAQFSSASNASYNTNLSQAVFGSNVEGFAIRWSATFTLAKIYGTSLNNQARSIIIQGGIKNFESVISSKYGAGTNTAVVFVKGDVLNCSIAVSIIDADDDSSYSGSIQINGNATNSSLSVGGSSTSSFDLGGNGGNISIGGNAIRCFISASGGERYTNSAETKGAGLGGNVYLYGSAIDTTILAEGGRLRGTLGLGRSGDGGSIIVSGDFINNNAFNLKAIDVSGGSRLGQGAGVAGSGGSIQIMGKCTSNGGTINASGGNNIATSPASVCGQVWFACGCDISTLFVNDGQGNGTLTAIRYISFNGICNIRRWEISGRTQVRIVSGRNLNGSATSNSKKAYIICTDRNGQIQLTKSDLTKTTSLISSDWITFYDGTNWYVQSYTGPKA